jgi:hypothetical protein
MKRIVLALFLAWALPVMGQERPALVFDQDKIEWALPWAQSSPCLGDTSDAFCLAATVVVCGVLRDRPECLPRGTYQPHYNPLGGNRIEYRVVRAGYVPFTNLWVFENHVIRDTEFETDLLVRRRAVAAQIVIRQKICDPWRPLCESDRETDILANLELRNGRWLLLGSTIHYPDLWKAD